MQGMVSTRRILRTIALCGALCGGLLLDARPSCSQTSAEPVNKQMDMEKIGALLQQLQSQIQQLHEQVSDLKVQQQSAKAESEQLRKALDTAMSQLAAMNAKPESTEANQKAAESTSAPRGLQDRVERLEENQQLADSKIAEQSQTKVESGSKYRLRLSGIALFNMFDNRGAVDNSDFPQLAVARGILATNSAFGGTFRQSQITIQAFGPTIAGARTSAEVDLDFAGGFPQVPNGTSFGLMRLRTGTVRFEWPQTTLVAGQDGLFFAPLSPTSLATLATPSLAYSGNLWGWTPQIHVEHSYAVSESSSVTLQAGILDSLSADTPGSTYNRNVGWGEASGQPAYAARVAWSGTIGGQAITIGGAGYYGRQAWGLGRHVDGWAGTIDAKVPLGNRFEFTSEFYRGRAIGGFGAGIGQTIVWNGSLFDPATEVHGLNSIGGWAQLKFRATSKLQFNGVFGSDNPFASELRDYGGSINYYPFPLSKNESGFVNFIYQPRSDIVFSMEYRRLKTFTLDRGTNAANIANLSVGYLF